MKARQLFVSTAFLLLGGVGVAADQQFYCPQAITVTCTGSDYSTCSLVSSQGSSIIPNLVVASAVPASPPGPGTYSSLRMLSASDLYNMPFCSYGNGDQSVFFELVPASSVTASYKPVMGSGTSWVYSSGEYQCSSDSPASCPYYISNSR